jgi:ABC-2 type transport system ATP-binding protein
VIIGRGRLIEDTTVRDLADRFRTGVLVRSPRAAELAGALESSGASVAAEPDGALSVTGLEVAGIADVAARRAIPLHEVTARRASLEDIYLLLTADSVEHRSRDPRPVR